MKPHSHIISWIFFSLVCFVQIWMIESLTGLLFLLAIMAVIAQLLKKWVAIFQNLRWMVYFLLLFALIQLFLRQDGNHVIWQEQLTITVGHWHAYLDLRLTMEALLETARALLQFLLFGIVFILIEPLLPAKRLLPYASKWFPNGAQMIYMTLRLVPHLKQRSERLEAVLQTRGYQPNQKRNWKESLHFRMPMMQSLLDETLEGAWHRAEAMIARGYGQGPRTLFREEQWGWFDFLIIVTSALSLFSNRWQALLFLLLVPFIVTVYWQKPGGKLN